MRNSYSAGAASVLLQNQLFFDKVYGLSAGATNAIDYLSRDVKRAKASLTLCLDDLAFRWQLTPFIFADRLGARSRKNATAQPGCALPFNFTSFQANPAELTLQAVDRDTGHTVYFTGEHFSTQEKLMKCVQASSSYPLIMPPTFIQGRALYDGGIGRGGGIMLPSAERDGLRRYFVISTRPKGYRKPLNREFRYDFFFWRRPQIKALLHTWSARYNAEMDRLNHLEAEGRAYTFYANDQQVENTERRIEKLIENYERGRLQAKKELGDWERFIKEEHQ